MALEKPAAPLASAAPKAAFGTVDLVWEQVEEAAVRAYRAGGAEAAFIHWRRGLSIARSRFDQADPRLGTSLTNYAFALRRRDETFLSRRHFMQAREVFAEDWRWIGRMQPPGPGEQGYDRAALWSIGRLVQDLHRRVRAIDAHDEIPVGRLERWRQERPGRGSDLRKLIAASFLLVSLPETD